MALSCHGRGAEPPFRTPPGTQCEPQDVAGLGPRRPRRAFRRSEPQDVAGLGPRRPRRAFRRSEPQDVAGLGPRRPRRAFRRGRAAGRRGAGAPPSEASIPEIRAAGRPRAGPRQRPRRPALKDCAGEAGARNSIPALFRDRLRESDLVRPERPPVDDAGGRSFPAARNASDPPRTTSPNWTPAVSAPWALEGRNDTIASVVPAPAHRGCPLLCRGGTRSATMIAPGREGGPAHGRPLLRPEGAVR